MAYVAPHFGNLKARATKLGLVITKTTTAEDARIYGGHQYVLHAPGADWENMECFQLGGIRAEIEDAERAALDATAAKALANYQAETAPAASAEIAPVESVTVTVSCEVSTALIHNAFVGAFEGGANYWLHSAEPVSITPHDTPQLVWWGEESVFQHPYSFKVEFENPGAGGGETATKTVTQDDVAKGLSIMATKYPGHFGDLISENDDATTHDVFVQCVVLGDIVFG